MDNILVEYLSSGKAFVLVGSGPTIAMGYPNWESLSGTAIKLLQLEFPEVDTIPIEKSHREKKFPEVFEKVAAVASMPRLLQTLNDAMTPVGTDDKEEVYRLIARWPIQVFMTTNYDNEIQKHLAESGEAYIDYDNSEDHFAYLTPDCRGAIFKLHGDLRSERGLILTSSHYNAIKSGPNWEYWRTKMTSIFQLLPVVIIGHSLTDVNIRHILELAKKGSGVERPVCWVAPYMKITDRLDYLTNYRIRVIPYDNSDGKHSGLIRLLQALTDFVPPRATIQIQQNIAAVSHSPLGDSAAAPGFFVFNRLAKYVDIDKMRDEAILGALQASLPVLSDMGTFSIEDVPSLLSWPAEMVKDPALLEKIRSIGEKENLFVGKEGRYHVLAEAQKVTEEARILFKHLRERFRNSVRLRIRRDFPAFNDKKAATIAEDIDASLAGYFREGGLMLAGSIFSPSSVKSKQSLPLSILKFVGEASAKYSDYESRLVFFKTSVDTFVRATDAERDYLGRISQGFFSLHALGLFGDEAASRLQHAKQTVWLVDSDSQIPALALAAPSNLTFASCFARLKGFGIRFFTTKSVAHETWRHLDFAVKLIQKNGETSPLVIAAAQGDAPYSRSNRFLQGFILWQAAGNPCDWQSYLYSALGTGEPTEDDVFAALSKIGIEPIELEEWPGFSSFDFAEREEDTEKIVHLAKRTLEPYGIENYIYLDYLDDLVKKAKPEAETLLVVKNERDGKYYMISDNGEHSPSWFISHTSILNLLVPGDRVTWQPESFIRFAEGLCPSPSSKEAAERAFEILLYQLAVSGVSTIDEKVIEQVFGGIIDQSRIQTKEQLEIYESTIASKYGESPEKVLSRLRPVRQPMASLQLAHEMAQVESQRRESAELETTRLRKQVKVAKKELNELSKYKKKLESKKAKAKRNKHKQKSGKKKKKKKK